MESIYEVGNGGGGETTWSTNPAVHLGPIKETWRPRPTHALMYNAHSPINAINAIYHFLARLYNYPPKNYDFQQRECTL